MITTTKPKKLWRGKSRLAKRLLGKRTKSSLEWAITIKPGDWIGTCEGCNRQITKIEYIWVNEGNFNRCKKNKTWVLYEVRFTDTCGNWHHAPGGGCAVPKYTIEEIEEDYREWIETAKDSSNIPWDEDGSFKKKLDKIEQLLNSGQSIVGVIVDENGENLKI